MKLSALLVGVALLGACEKGGGGTTGTVSADEKAFLQYLPAGETAIFGGNYLKFQDWMTTSPLGKIMGDLTKMAPGLDAWTKCFLKVQNMKMMGGFKVDGMTGEMRMIMSGITVSDVEGCANEAKFNPTVDADKKFVGLDLPNPMAGGSVRTGYLVLPNGALYSRQAMPFGGGSITSVDRKTLEAEIAALSAGTAEKDTALVDAIATVDRSKAMWIVGTGAHTPAADKIGLVKGWVDIGSGLSFDISTQIKDATISDQIMKGVPQMKQQAGAMGGAVGDVVKALDVSKSGDITRFKLSITNDQLQKLIDQVGPLLQSGMLGR